MSRLHVSVRSPGTWIVLAGLVLAGCTCAKPDFWPRNGAVTTLAPARGYNSWPMLGTVGNRLVCVYSRGTAHSIAEGARGAFACVSTDGGASWSDSVPVADDPSCGEVPIGKGHDAEGALLVWIRCCGGKDGTHHDLYRSTDGRHFTRLAVLRPQPMPMQITDVFAVAGKLVSFWFATDYNRAARHSAWGLVESADNGRTWQSRTVERDLAVADLPTEPSGAVLDDGRILAIARCEDGRAQFQLDSRDGGATWTKRRTNICDVMASTPSLVYDSAAGTVANYYFERGAGLLKVRTADAAEVLKRPDSWPAPRVLAQGGMGRPWDSGNASAVMAADGRHHVAWYAGNDAHNTAVLALAVGETARDERVPEGAKVIAVRPGEDLVAVRDAVRALPAAEKARGVEVRLAPGRYVLARELALGAQDSGVSAAAPVVWRGAPEGGTALVGGRDVPTARFAPDPTRPGVLVADISDWKASWPAAPRHECSDPYPFPELFVDGERYVPAGWPDWPTVAAAGDTNGGWTTISRFVDKGTQSNTGSVADAGKFVRPSAPRGGTFGYATDRPLRWTNTPDVLLHGFWCFDWSESKIPVKSINTASNTITLAYQHSYGVRKGNPSPRRWRALNLLSELDRPGEYFVDTRANRVYVMPRRPFTATTHVTVTWENFSLVSCLGVANVVLADMEMTAGWRSAVLGSAVTNVVLQNLNIHGFRLRGVDLWKDASRCRVRDTHVWDTGNGGIYVEGGDRRTLARGENLVENCLVNGFSQNRLTSAYAVRMGGCGNAARHNEMYDAPHQAAMMAGNDNLFEYNVVSNVLQCTDDAGAYYVGRNPSCRGTVLRYDLFQDIGSERGHGNAAIYFDDGDGGNDVYGCAFVRCGAPGKGSFGTVFSHGGYSNIVRNCLFVDCKRPLGSAPWKQARWEAFLKEPYLVARIKKAVDIESPVYLAHYPALKGYLPGQPDAARDNAAYDNVLVNAWQVKSGRWATNATDVVSATLPPGDRNAACRRLLPSFLPIPYAKIGRMPR